MENHPPIDFQWFAGHCTLYNIRGSKFVWRRIDSRRVENFSFINEINVINDKFETLYFQFFKRTSPSKSIYKYIFFFERLKVEAAPSFSRRSNDHPNGRPSFLIRLSRKERCCVLLVGKVTGERVRRKIDTPRLFVIVSASVGEQMEVLLAGRRKKQETNDVAEKVFQSVRCSQRDPTLN